MTLSLINLDNMPMKTDKIDTDGAADMESPLADDIEIIGHDEN